MANQHQPNSPNAPAMVTPTLEQYAHTLGANATVATALDTSLPCVGGPALLDIQMTVTKSHSEIPQVGPAGPAATGTQAGHPAEVGSLAEALATVPTKASALAKAPPSTAAKEVREDPHTVDKEAPPHTGTK